MAKSSKKLKMGHVQDTPVSTSMISNVCMICHMKVHIVSYNLDQKKISKSKIHILPNYEQTNLKTAIVTCPLYLMITVWAFWLFWNSAWTRQQKYFINWLPCQDWHSLKIMPYENIFSNFSRMFLIPINFFQFEF